MPSARELEKGENQQSVSGTHEAELACQVEKPGWKSEQLYFANFSRERPLQHIEVAGNGNQGGTAENNLRP